MKTKLLFSLMLALVLALSVVLTAGAANERIYFTKDEVCDNDLMTIARAIYNGQGNMLLKGFSVTCHETSANPMFTGTAYVEGNTQMVGKGIWTLRGKARVETTEGGVWNINCIFPWPAPEMICNGQGEGLYAGWHIVVRPDESYFVMPGN